MSLIDSIGSFFGRDAALRQLGDFKSFSDAAWNAADDVLSDPTVPAPMRGLVASSEPFMAVGLGTLGFATDVAATVRDPSLLVEPFMHPVQTLVSMKQGVVDFFSDANPFHQTQALITNFADPAAAGAHLAGGLGRMSATSHVPSLMQATDTALGAVGDAGGSLATADVLAQQARRDSAGSDPSSGQASLTSYWADKMPSLDDAPQRLGQPDRDFSGFMKARWTEESIAAPVDGRLTPLPRAGLVVDYEFPGFVGVLDEFSSGMTYDDHFVSGHFFTSPLTKAQPEHGLYLDHFEVRESNHPLAPAFGSSSEMFASMLKKAEDFSGLPVNHISAGIFESDHQLAVAHGDEWAAADGRRLHQLLREGMDPRDALGHTWIGRQTDSLGFTQVTIDPQQTWDTAFTPRPGHGADLLFSRPDADPGHLLDWIWNPPTFDTD